MSLLGAARPSRSSQSAIAQALLQAHWLTKWVVKASPSTASAASTTWCPSDSHSVAAPCTVATQSAWTVAAGGRVRHDRDVQPLRWVAAAATNEGPRSGAPRRVAGNRPGGHVEDGGRVAYRAGQHMLAHQAADHPRRTGAPGNCVPGSA